MENVKFFDGKKFMWDGIVYDTEDKAREMMNSYIKQEFETRMIEQEGKFLLYTRRVVKEVVVEGPPPII